MSEPLDHGSDPGPQAPSPPVSDDEASRQRNEEHGELGLEAPPSSVATAAPHDAASDPHAQPPTAEPPDRSDDTAVARRKAKRVYLSIPEDLELRLLQALMANVRALANKRYDLVREPPEFALWIGRAQGAAGKKRFRRLLNQIVAPGRSTAHPGGGDTRAEQEAWADEQLAANGNALGDLAPRFLRSLAAAFP
jgi:hypothetical protein